FLLFLNFLVQYFQHVQHHCRVVFHYFQRFVCTPSFNTSTSSNSRFSNLLRKNKYTDAAANNPMIIIGITPAPVEGRVASTGTLAAKHSTCLAGFMNNGVETLLPKNSSSN